MVIFGLTGSLGSGKTTVAEMFARLGAEVIDADAIAHELLSEDGPCRRRVRKAFPEAADSGGGICRRKLAQAVFGDQDKLEQLEALVHPAVQRRIGERLRALPRRCVVVLDIPLLFEAGMEGLADAVIVVRATRSQQIERVVKARGITRAAAAARLRRQMPQKEKLKRADFIVDNRFSKAETRAQVRRIWDGLVQV